MFRMTKKGRKLSLSKMPESVKTVTCQQQQPDRITTQPPSQNSQFTEIDHEWQIVNKNNNKLKGEQSTSQCILTENYLNTKQTNKSMVPQRIRMMKTHNNLSLRRPNRNIKIKKLQNQGDLLIRYETTNIITEAELEQIIMHSAVTKSIDPSQQVIGQLKQYLRYKIMGKNKQISHQQIERELERYLSKRQQKKKIDNSIRNSMSTIDNLINQKIDSLNLLLQFDQEP